MPPGTLRRILLAEDDADIRDVARMALNLIGGFEVEVCLSGADVLPKARAFKPDMVVLDAMMPGIDGPSALRLLRNEPGFETIPVIFMTAKVMHEEVERFLRMGAIGVIAKPFAPESLPEQVARHWSARNRG